MLYLQNLFYTKHFRKTLEFPKLHHPVKSAAVEKTIIFWELKILDCLHGGIISPVFGMHEFGEPSAFYLAILLPLVVELLLLPLKTCFPGMGLLI